MEILLAEITSMKQAAHLQAEASDGLRVATSNINRRACALETSAGVRLGPAVVNNGDPSADRWLVVESDPARIVGLVPSDVERSSLMERAGEMPSLPELPLWSLVAKRGRCRTAGPAGRTKLRWPAETW